MIHDATYFAARARLAAKHGSEPCLDARNRIVGAGRAVPISGGRRVMYVNFDNAATTPALKDVADCVVEFLDWYGSVHRGTGARSHVSTHCYDRSREIIAAFVGADPDYHTAIFTRNTTDSINKLAGVLSREERPLVLCTVLEHHSNLLPWRRNAGRVECVDCRASDASLDLEQLERKLREHSGAVRLVAVTGASNVTGFAPPIHDIARLAHRHGAEIFVDAAQLAAHHPLDMGRPGEPESLDYVAFSAHKMYAPFGAGILVGPKAAFERGEPTQVGGGTVRLVSDDRIIWADAPAREEGGTPNLVGAVAMAKAAQVLGEIGMGRVAAHEWALRTHMVDLLRGIPRVRLFGAEPPADHSQVSIVGFTADGMDHGLLAAALGHEWGIGLRHGCFCAHPYVLRLLGVGPQEVERLARKAELNDRSGFPGLVRISLGLYNTRQEVDYVAEAVRDLLDRGPRERYVFDRRTGEYTPESGCVWPEECCPL
ncbi:MAG: aminotransferase class V-fold PLP-dependent enzyme [Candidatus Brocadiia bacterium]|jgi:selenocysteine lyase/cysteine desulfurase